MAQRIKWEELTPLTEDNTGYEPEIEEIMEYAQFIGLVMPQDSKYLYLAREGLKAPLPPFWEACEGPQGELFFRNRKTRAITVQNPLDELYIQKVKQVRQLEAQTNIFSILEESALNESSGLVKSRTKAEMRKSDKVNNSNHQRPVLERHITEQSQYSQFPSAQRGYPYKSDLFEQPEWKLMQRQKLDELINVIDSFVPKKEQLVTGNWLGGQVKGVSAEQLLALNDLKVEVANKRAKFEQRKAERRILQNTLSQIRSQNI